MCSVGEVAYLISTDDLSRPRLVSRAYDGCSKVASREATFAAEARIVTEANYYHTDDYLGHQTNNAFTTHRIYNDATSRHTAHKESPAILI